MSVSRRATAVVIALCAIAAAYFNAISTAAAAELAAAELAASTVESPAKTAQSVAVVADPDRTVAAATKAVEQQTLQTLIDHHIDAKLAAANVKPAPDCGDGAFLRRAMLDLAGRIPTADEAQAFGASTDSNKRAQLVDSLLSADAFARHQRNELDAMFMGDKSDGAFREYLERAARSNRPWDRMFRDMMSPDENDADQKGASYFLRSKTKTLDDVTRDTSRLFLGVDVGCAKCHDHPLVDDWKQDHYFGMQSFFNRTVVGKNWVGEKNDGVVKFKTTSGEEKLAKLMFLTGLVIAEPPSSEPTSDGKNADDKEAKKRKKQDENKDTPPPPDFSRRNQLIETTLHPDHDHYFSRSIVNRLWARLTGQGFVTPLDQMHSENAPSHPELLQALADDLVAHNYDLRRLLRGMMLSRVYARSSRWEASSDRPAADLYAVANIRPLTPAQFATSLSLATANQTSLPAAEKGNERTKALAQFEQRAGSLSSKLDYPDDQFQFSVSEALLLSNGQSIEKEYLAAGNDRLLGQLAKITDSKQAVTAAYWSVLSRAPDTEELSLIDTYLSERSQRSPEAMRQLVWSLITSSEFRFNH